jgi:hypothetical protein
MAVVPVHPGGGGTGTGNGEPPTPIPALRRTRWWADLLLIVWLLWLYDMTTDLAPLRQSAAVAHGWSVFHLEATLHIGWERTLDHWLAAQHTVALWLSDYYDNAHFVVTLAVIAWLWWRHSGEYRAMRATLVVANLIAFVVFWWYPTAPPRLLAGAGIADVVAASGAFGSWHSGALASDANQFAAMPSLHLVWAAWCALAAWLVYRRRTRWAALAWAYPALTLFAVLATGNHYLLDTVAGLATLAVAYAVVRVAQPRLHERRDQRRRRRQPSGRIESMTSSTVTAPTSRSASSQTATLTRS